LFAADGPQELVGQLSTRFGRQPPLPDWAIGGAIVGLKDGARSFERLERFIEAGTAVSGLWCEDWAGIRETSFGRRLFWDWRRDNQRYPDLPQRIARTGGARASAFWPMPTPISRSTASSMKRRRKGTFLPAPGQRRVYLVDFGEFDCGVIDFTRAETRAWFAEKVLGREMLDIGISGWMADFGEYLPTDVRLADGSDPMEAHNRWPVLWAEGQRDGRGQPGPDGRRGVLHARGLFRRAGALSAAVGGGPVGRFHPA
jgi:alpha-glucosidase